MTPALESPPRDPGEASSGGSDAARASRMDAADVADSTASSPLSDRDSSSSSNGAEQAPASPSGRSILADIFPGYDAGAEVWAVGAVTGAGTHTSQQQRGSGEGGSTSSSGGGGSSRQQRGREPRAPTRRSADMDAMILQVARARRPLDAHPDSMVGSLQRALGMAPPPPPPAALLPPGQAQAGGVGPQRGRAQQHWDQSLRADQQQQQQRGGGAHARAAQRQSSPRPPPPPAATDPPRRRRSDGDRAPGAASYAASDGASAASLDALLGMLRSTEPTGARQVPHNMPPDVARELAVAAVATGQRRGIRPPRSSSAEGRWDAAARLRDGGGDGAAAAQAAARRQSSMGASSSSGGGGGGVVFSPPPPSAARLLAATAAGTLAVALPSSESPSDASSESPLGSSPGGGSGASRGEGGGRGRGGGGGDGESGGGGDDYDGASRGGNSGSDGAPGGGGGYAGWGSRARGYFLQRALWVLEEVGGRGGSQALAAVAAGGASTVPPPSGVGGVSVGVGVGGASTAEGPGPRVGVSPRALAASSDLNRLLVRHATAGSSTWRDVAGAVLDMGQYMDAVCVGCYLQVLAARAPPDARARWLADSATPSSARDGGGSGGSGGSGRTRGSSSSSSAFSSGGASGANSGDGSPDDRLLARALSCLLPLAGRQTAPPGAAATSLHALSRLVPSGAPRLETADALARALLARLAATADRASPRTLCVALYAASRVARRPDTLPPGLLRAVCAHGAPAERLGAFSPAELASLPASLGALGLHAPVAWMDAFADHAATRMHGMGPRDLLLMLRAVHARGKAQARWRPPAAFVEGLLAACKVGLPTFLPHQLCGMAVGLAQAGVYPHQGWLDALQAHVVHTRGSFTPRELSLLLGALAALLRKRAPPREDLLPAAAQALASSRHPASARTLSRFVSAASNLAGRLPPGEAAGGARGALAASLLDMEHQLLEAASASARLSLSHAHGPDGPSAADGACGGSAGGDPYSPYESQTRRTGSSGSGGSSASAAPGVYGSGSGASVRSYDGPGSDPYYQSQARGTTGGGASSASAAPGVYGGGGGAGVRSYDAPGGDDPYPGYQSAAQRPSGGDPYYPPGGGSGGGGGGDGERWGRRGGGARAAEAAREHALDAFLACQLLTGCLDLLGTSTPPRLARALEGALLAAHAAGPRDAPATSWRQLAAAYGATRLPGPLTPELARLLVVLA
ncbi:hypothetical protein FOA52_011412 [Chlamydomonas sp. UWO 241]|nr:hypothetical protein FOA52_011412 [Chlamydomonas sp. UWO 241]